ncbi:hypothetical protein CRENBAI_006796 [Crenichthys baileyi]|uniref:G-protein coupled receptors family 1 profile domain-containing protein n=1 Tax=Crenichthys baileyi TaxID=28760 RepID=A0AAV9RMX8_9TELE
MAEEDTAYELFFDNSTANTHTSDGPADFDLNVYEPCTTQQKLKSESGNKILLPTVYGIIFTLGIVGNGLVFLVVGYQKMVKTTTDKYQLHLSFALLLFVLTLPFWAADAVEMWHLGGFLCVSVHVIYTVNLYSSVLILAFVSLDRYLAVIHATDTRATRKLLASRVIYVEAWLPAAILTALDLVFARVQDVQDVSSSGYLIAEDGVESAGSSTTCQRFYPAESGLTWMAVFRFQHILVGFVLPGVVILVCYCTIISSFSRGHVLKKKKKALKKMLILVICFFSCWLPYYLVIFVDTLTMLNVIVSSSSPIFWVQITHVFHSTYSLSSSSGAPSPSEFVKMSTSHEETEDEGESVVDSDTGTGIRDEVDAEASGNSQLP